MLVGDFNTLAPGELLDVERMPRWIRAMVWLSGRDIQRETIQVMLDASYLDGYRLFTRMIKDTAFRRGTPTCGSTTHSCPRDSQTG